MSRFADLNHCLSHAFRFVEKVYSDVGDCSYLADHWCSRGHVLLVLEGELITELKDGRKFTMRPAMSYQVVSDAEPHRSRTTVGAKLFIVD